MGRLTEEVEDGVDCSFGKRTMNMNKRDGLASNKAGNFGSHAQDGVPLPPEHQGPRDLRFAIRQHLVNGPLGKRAFGYIGKLGGQLKAATARGERKIFIFDMSGFDVSELKVSKVVSSGKKAIADKARRATSWQATLEKCKAEQPVLFCVLPETFLGALVRDSASWGPNLGNYERRA